MFATDSKEYALLSKLNTPEKIQTFLEKIPFNHELDGETCMSPLRVLRERRAHCLEAGMLAAVCLKIQGEKPLVVNMKAMKGDYDHIITIFRKNGYYGGISKTNHLVLRYRDPIYRSVRELMMSYFHEFFLTKSGKKTLLGYSNPINLNRFGTKWITAEEDLWDIGGIIFDAPYVPMVPKENKKYIRLAQPFERLGDKIVEWKK